MAEGETRGAYWTDSTPSATHGTSFWFLRPILRLGLPTFAVLGLLGIGLFTMPLAVAMLAREFMILLLHV